MAVAILIHSTYIYIYIEREREMHNIMNPHDAAVSKCANCTASLRPLQITITKMVQQATSTATALVELM